MAKTIRMGNVPTKREKLNQMENLNYNLCAQAQYLSNHGLLNSMVNSVWQITLAFRFHMEKNLTN